MKYVIRKLGTIGLGLALSLSVPMIAQAKTLYFGIVPQQAASKLAKMWVPFMKELSAETGLDIRFATMKDIPSFEQCLAQGAYDIAYMNPYHYTVFSQQSGYRAIAHQTEKKLKGILVVKADAPYTDITQLGGNKLAFPSPAAFGASVLPRAEMKGQGIDIEPMYVKSHDSVYKSVASGLFIAGGGVARTFNSVSEDIKKQLRIIYTTKGYTPHAFAVNKQMSEIDMIKISDALLHLSEHKNETVKGIGMKGLETASDASWDDVRALNLSQSETQIIKQGDLKCRFD